MAFFIGIDCGSQGTKAVVVDGETGVVRGQASASYGLIEGLPPGHREQHPETWVRAATETVRQALSHSRVEPTRVKGIGVSGQQHGFVPLDSRRRVIRPAKLWNDTSTTEECALLLERLGGIRRAVELTGNMILPGFTAPKILWMKRHEPVNYTSLAHVLLPHDYLNLWLTGSTVMEAGDASGTALMDVRRRRWCVEAVEAVDPDLLPKLPEIHSSAESAGALTSEAARTLGLRPGVVVSAGGGDNMMGAIGTGNTRRGVATVSLGTSGTVYSYSPEPLMDPLGEAHAFCDSTGGWLPLACTMNVTVATELVRRLFGYDYAALEDAVSKAPPGSDGLILLPYLQGERVPSVPDGKGVLFGLNDETFNASHIARAAMEGVTLGINYGLRRLRDMGVDAREIRLTGGGARNPAWRRIAADVFDAEVVCLKADEGAAYGAALQALWTLGRLNGQPEQISVITDHFVETDEATRVEPDPRNVETYRRLQARQDQLGRDLRAAFKAASG